MRFSVQGDYVFDRKGETAVARRNERNASFGIFFLLSFFFWLEQERARWAMKRVRSTEKTRSIECVFSVQGDYVFDRASLFLLALLRQKKKRYRRRILSVGVGAFDDPCKTQGYLYKRR